MPNYGDPDYWEKRYEEQKGKTFDWLEDYESLKSIIKGLVDQSARILVLGCGNAELGEDMYNDGYKNINNIDISKVVIDQMISRNTDRPEMTWEVMDVRELKFPSNTFDIAIDKSTIDALLCGEDAYVNVALMTREVQRVLKVGGYYMVISYGVPDTRLDHFNWKFLHWDVSHQVLNEGTDNPHYIYLCRKKPGADEIPQENWDEVIRTLTEDKEQDVSAEDEF
jgi:ubiquinone/menaquinone biosynthesis C-methylase UbiE